jgi:hypothetical protein
VSTKVMSVDLATLRAGTVVEINLRDGRTIRAVVELPAIGQIILCQPDGRVQKVVYRNQAGRYVLNVGSVMRLTETDAMARVVSLNIYQQPRLLEHCRGKGVSEYDLRMLDALFDRLEALAAA